MKIYPAAAKLKLRLSQRLGRLLLGPIGGQTSSFIRSLDEVSYRPAIARHLTHRETMFEACVATYPFPEHYPPHFRRVKAFDERPLFLLKDVIISPHSGQIWTPEGLMLEESVGSLRRMIGWGATIHEPLLPAQSLNHPRPIVACAPTGYFHWLLEVMPAMLQALQAYPEADVLLPPTAPRYIREILHLLFGAEAERRIISSNTPIRAPQVLMPAMQPYSGFVRLEEAMLLRDAFVHTPAGATGRQIYVSRSKAPRRGLDNEAELEAVLVDIGFEIVYAEDLSLAQQIAAYQGADTIVAPHGAGLANLVWAPKRARVVEVFPATIFNDCYARLSVVLGLHYGFVTCAPGKNSGVIPVREVLEQLKTVAA